MGKLEAALAMLMESLDQLLKAISKRRMEGNNLWKTWRGRREN